MTVKKGSCVFVSIILFFVLAIIVGTDLAWSEREHLIKVGLTSSGPWRLKLTGATRIYYRNQLGVWSLLRERVEPERTWFICQNEKGLELTTGLGDEIISDYPVRFSPLSGSAGMDLNGRKYLGELEFWPIMDRQTKAVDAVREPSVFNHIGLEDYVCGVLAGEAYAGWQTEALAALAVAVRSYSLHNLGKHQSYDFCDQPHCQKYLGLPSEPQFAEAVARTKNQILLWEGQIINAVYHGSSGGHTRNNEEVWDGEPLPYLRGVIDFDQTGKEFAWKETHLFKVGDFLAGLDLKDPKQLVMTPLFNTNDSLYGFSFCGKADKHEARQFTNESIRRVFGFQSSNFQVYRIKGEDLEKALKKTTILSLFTKEELKGYLALEGVVALRLRGEKVTGPVLLFSDEYLIFTGNGSGHGVGLSQWGAQAMAEQGHCYRRILQHYYGAGVELRMME